METKRPLTPPADFMDIDMNSQGATLSNGHHLKDSSPNTALLTGNSTQATSIDDIESTEVNGVNEPAVKANEIANKLNSHYPVFNEGDAPSIAALHQPHDYVVDPQEEGTEESTVNSTSLLPQQPTSELREEPQPATLEQTEEIKEQKQQEDIDRDPELANGLLSDNTQATELPMAMESQAPAPSVSELKSDSAPSDERHTQEPTASEPPIATADMPHHPPIPVPDGRLPEEPVDPAPSPSQPNSSSNQTQDPEPMSLDHQLPADPQSPSKMSRPREEDGDEAPAAKRSKIDGENSPSNHVPTNTDFKVPAQPGHGPVTNISTSTQNPSEPAKPITAAQKKHLIKAIQNTKRSHDAKPFLAPVDPVALNIPGYPDVVKNPMDLKTMEEKLKSDQYPSVETFKSDFDQIIQNSIVFNGIEHPVTKNGYAMGKVFERGMANLPGPEVQDPAATDKKSRKASLPLANKVVPPRRESRTSLPAATAPSPVPAQSPTTFALNPQGIPLIRRDSTKGDGRPKREIHPPAPRDLPYANSKPKKKKYQAELKFCLHILNELAKPRYSALTAPFAIPVDPVALNIPDYHSVIKKPMDLRTIREKLENGQYENAKEFDSDIRLMFANCHKYNGPDHPIRAQAKQLEGIFDQEMTHKRTWIDANSPISGQQSTTSSDVEDEDEEEDEDEAEEAADEDQLTKLQRSIAEMSEQVRLLQQKKKSPPAAGKKPSKGAKPEKKATKKGASGQATKAEKKAPAKHSKKEQYVTYEQKQDISNRINSLSEPKMAKALKIIRDNMPSLKVEDKPLSRSSLSSRGHVALDDGLTFATSQGVQDDELELDIDELSDDVLRKLHDFVKKNSKGPDEAPRPQPSVTAAQAPARKKNKPMSKQEQERQIQDLRNISSQFQNPTPSIENAPDAYAVHNDSSGDEDDSEESEEE
ncbi:MAG: hypothetical protein Q9225_002659 [Loekoesia sp. 1 TL-2023]